MALLLIYYPKIIEKSWCNVIDISIYDIVGSFVATFATLYLMLVLNNMKNIVKSRKFWISIIFSSLYVYLSFLLTNSVSKVILEFVIKIFLCMYILGFKKTMLSKVCINCFVVWVGMLLIEILFYPLIMLVLSRFISINSITLNDNQILKFVINCLMFFILSLVFYIPKLRKSINYITNNHVANNKKYIFYLIIASVSMFSISVYLCFFNYNSIVISVVLFIMIMIYTIVVIVTIRSFNQKNKIQAEYEVLLTNLSEYENLLDRQRILNHENKNQLLVIKGMINKKENAVDYIDTLVDTQYKDNDLIIMKTNRIPSGGLKGLIYYKMLNMKDKKINISLDVNRNINDIDFSKISISTNQELCKIVGVFLDNAMQEVEGLNERYVSIVIEANDNNLIINISNNYANKDVNKIGEKGYTTKGSGHGYGLRLVKSIVENNKSLEHFTEVNGKIFTQIVKLKIKD